MKQKKQIINFLIAIIIFLIIPSNIKASNEDINLERLDYYINSYDINIKVNENNTMYITEKISAYFNIEKHGIYRKIPLTNQIIRLDGTKSKNHAKISKIHVNEKYSLSKENGYRIIKIGDENLTLSGPKNYEINYLYNIGKDPVKGYDELYFNLIGNEWDTIIKNITFNITMPKNFDSSKLGFSSGVEGSTNFSNVTYNINNNTINGKYNEILHSGEGLTIRLELPEGYYKNASYNIQITDFLMYTIPILGLIIAFLLWNKYGKDTSIIETVEFYPPNNLNSLDIGFLYKGEADNKDVVSLLIYLANKGYIKITEDENFTITKVKEYDGKNENEKIFFNGLFEKVESTDYDKIDEILNEAEIKNEDISYDQALEKAKVITKRNTVKKDDLYNEFYITKNKILENFNKKDNKYLIIEKNSKTKSIYVLLLIVISLLSIIIIPTYDYAGINGTISTLAIILVILPIWLPTLAKGQKIFQIIWAIMASIPTIMLCFLTENSPIIECLFKSLKYNTNYLIAFIIGIICTFIIFVVYILMPKRTTYGSEMLGKIKGFKNFLETVEKEKLESLVLKNPTYFYDILPYTYVLGISDLWMDKFKTITLKAPDWYDGYSSFDNETMNDFMNSTMSSASSTMTSFSSSSSSGSDFSRGGSSGGGSSGRGSGGGGGGSW